MNRGVFRTQLNIYDGAFLRKQLNLLAINYPRKLHSVKDVWLDSKYASAESSYNTDIELSFSFKIKEIESQLTNKLASK